MENFFECSFTQLEGVGSYGAETFTFAPDDPVAGRVEKFRRRGVATQTSDGEFEFVATPSHKSQARLLKKYAHGRLSYTKDKAFLLTLKLYTDEPCSLSKALKEEVKDAYKIVKKLERELGDFD